MDKIKLPLSSHLTYSTNQTPTLSVTNCSLTSNKTRTYLISRYSRVNYFISIPLINLSKIAGHYIEHTSCSSRSTYCLEVSQHLRIHTTNSAHFPESTSSAQSACLSAFNNTTSDERIVLLSWFFLIILKNRFAKCL